MPQLYPTFEHSVGYQHTWLTSGSLDYNTHKIGYNTHKIGNDTPTDAAVTPQLGNGRRRRPYKGTFIT